MRCASRVRLAAGGVDAAYPYPAATAEQVRDLLHRLPGQPCPGLLSPSRSRAGFTYVAFIVDVYAQKIVAWHAATDKRTPLVLTPLRLALWDRDRHGHPVLAGELVHHHDAGSQTSIRFTEHLALEEIAPSIGSVGDAYDNALMESIIVLYKTECARPGPFHDRPLRTIADVEYATMAWVDWWNTRRLHSALGMLTPDEFEKAQYAALTDEMQPV